MAPGLGRTPQTSRLDPNPHTRRVRDIAYVLRHRLRAFSLWRAYMSAYPGGLVSPAMAAGMLGVSREYVSKLINAGKLPAVEMPAELGGRKLIPVDAVVAVGTRLERGRPLEFKPGSPLGRRAVPMPNPYALWCGQLAEAQKNANGTKKSAI